MCLDFTSALVQDLDDQGMSGEVGYQLDRRKTGGWNNDKKLMLATQGCYGVA